MTKLVERLVAICSFVIGTLFGLFAMGYSTAGLLDRFGVRIYNEPAYVEPLLLVAYVILSCVFGSWISKKSRIFGVNSLRYISDLKDEQLQLLLRFWIAASGIWGIWIIARQFALTDSWDRGHGDFYYILAGLIFGGPLIILGLVHLLAWVMKGKKA